MTTTASVSHPTANSSRLTSESDFQSRDEEDEPYRRIINIYFNFLSRGGIAIFGSANNVINMVIFYRLGLKDSMNVGLMALSINDFLSSFVCIAAIAYVIWFRFFPNTALDPLVVENVSLGWARDLLFLCSAWITTLLSIERCVCVTFPFKVKQIFTRLRCVVAVVVIYVVHISIYAPVFSSHWLQWTKAKVDTGNGSVYLDRLVVIYSKTRKSIMLFIDILTGSVSPIPAQILVLASVTWMIYGLRVSSLVRSSDTSQWSDTNVGRKGTKLSYKEKRLVKVTLFLAIILTLCNIPRFIAIFAKQIFPDVGFGQSYAHIHVLLWTIAILACTVNSSVNIFVYLILNSSYRARFKEMFVFTEKR